MLNAQKLAGELLGRLETLLDAGAIDREHVRMIIVGPTNDQQALSIWARETWDEYFDVGDAPSLARVSLQAWIDIVDALEEELPEAPINDVYGLIPYGAVHRLDKPVYQSRMNAEWARLRNVVQEALREIAVREPLVSLPGLVGLFSARLDPKQSSTVELAAFCHPHGGIGLLPVRDERPNYESCYHWAALPPEGIVSFFPQGETVDLFVEDEEAQPSVTQFPFDDMVMTQLIGRHDNIGFRMSGELKDRRYAHGHTYEERGGPSADEVDEALRAHLRSRPELLFDPLRFPSVGDGEAVQRWLDVYRSTRQKTGPQVLEHLVEKQGLEAADAFLSQQPPDDESRGETLACWARKLAEHGRDEACLAVCEALSGSPRGGAGRYELAALMRLGRWEAVPGRYDDIVQEAPEAAGYLAPWKAIALTRLGHRDEARALIEPLTEKDAKRRWEKDCLYALALTQYEDDPVGAVALLRQALMAGDPNLEGDFELHLEQMPELLAIMRERHRLLVDCRRLGDELNEKLVRVSVDTLVLEGPMTPEPGAPVWSLQHQTEIEGASHMKSLVALGEYVYVPDQTNGLRIFGRDPSAGQLAHMAIDSGASYEALTTDGRYLYAASYRSGLHIIDASDPLSPRIIARVDSWAEEMNNLVTVANGIAVVGNWHLDIFDVRDPTSPRRLTAIGDGRPAMEPSYYGAAELVGHHLFLTSHRYGLMILDLSEPSAPRLEAALTFEDYWRRPAMAIVGELALLCGDGEHTWIVDISNPASPRSVGTLPISWSVRPRMRGDAIEVMDRNGRNWSLDLSEPTRPRVLAVHERLDAKGEAYDVREPTDGMQVDDNLVLLCENKLQRLQFGDDPRPSFAEERAAIDALRTPLHAWCKARLEEIARDQPDFRAGLVALGGWGDLLELKVEGLSSLLGIDRRLDNEQTSSFTVRATELLPDPPAEPGHYDPRRESLLGREQARMLRAVLEELAESGAMRRIASGRTYLVLRGPVGTAVAKVLLDPERPWISSAVIEDKAPPTVTELLEAPDAYENLDALERRARSENEAFETVLRLVVEGNGYAQQIAARLHDTHADRVLDAFLEAADCGRMKFAGLPVLVDHQDRPEVSAFLEQRLREGKPRTRVAIATAIGRADSDEMVALARELLAQQNDFEAADLAGELLSAMEARLPELLEPLLAWVERVDEGDNRIPTIAPHLFRAGHRELPAIVAAHSRRTKSDEQHHDDNMFGSWEQHEACKAERLWTGWMLAERVRALREAGDTASSIWPESLPPEPYGPSWRYVLQAARPHLPEPEAWDWVHDRIAKHLLPDDRYTAERDLARLLFKDAYKEQNWRLALQLGEAIIAAPGDTFEQHEISAIKSKLFYVRLMEGWELLKARELDAARRMADALLNETPNDGQALFFDARLTWLEDSIDAAMAKVDHYLTRISKNDRPGRGRLCNLVGCALDEVGRYDEALLWFEKAAQAHPEDAATYLANLAEIHEKRGDVDEAVRWAKAAQEKGSSSDIVVRLVAGAS